MSKLRTNMVYQSVYQILAICVPLVTSPYLSRVIGAEGLGVYSYYYSIVSYFMLFALLGVTAYGMRTIAQCSNREEVSRNFFEIYFFQLISSSVTLLTYVIFVLIFIKSELAKIVSFIHVLYLIGEVVNINWLFFGLEKYKTTVIRNILIKIATVLSIFVFVRTKSDVVTYILILALGNVISNAVLWIKIKECITPVKVTWAGVKKHIKPNIILFIPAVAASVYHVMDKTMLGMFSDIKNSGYYYNADKLLNIPLTVITGCSNVFMSRISCLVGEKNEEKCKKTQDESIFLGMFFISAVAFGICAVSGEFVPLFFGKGFDPCINLVKYFAAIVILKTISTHTRAAFLIPEGNDKSYAKAVVCGAGINLVANYILIAVLDYGALGATLGTLIAEFAVVVAQILYMGSYSSKKNCLSGIIKSIIYLILGYLMLCIINCIPFVNYTPNIVMLLLYKVITGVVVYMCACIVLWKFKPVLMPDMVGDIFHSVKKKYFIKNVK